MTGNRHARPIGLLLGSPFVLIGLILLFRGRVGVGLAFLLLGAASVATGRRAARPVDGPAAAPLAGPNTEPGAAPDRRGVQRLEAIGHAAGRPMSVVVR